jgi:hypothetical protein
MNGEYTHCKLVAVASIDALGVTSNRCRTRIVIKHQILDETSYDLLVRCLLSAAGVGNFHIFCPFQVHSLPNWVVSISESGLDLDNFELIICSK